jgi:hypothetical protein
LAKSAPITASIRLVLQFYENDSFVWIIAKKCDAGNEQNRAR